MDDVAKKREKGRRGQKGRNNKPPTSTSKKRNKKKLLARKDSEKLGKGEEPLREFVDGLKQLGNVHCISLSRTHMRESEHEPLNILISPFLFKYLESFDHDPVTADGEEVSEGEERQGEDEIGETKSVELPVGCVRELGLAYRRMFQIFEETDFVPPFSTTLPFSNERIQSFKHVTILPGILHHELFKEVLPEELRADRKRWINTPDDFLKVPLSKKGSDHLFLLLGSDPCVHHPSNMCRSMVNNALIYYSLLSKLGFTWDNIHHCLVTLLPQPRQEGDPDSLNRVLRMVTIIASRKTTVEFFGGKGELGELGDLGELGKGERVFIASTPVDYTQEDYRYIEGMIAYGLSSLTEEKEEDWEFGERGKGKGKLDEES
jgi:hypothetical protein